MKQGIYDLIVSNALKSALETLPSGLSPTEAAISMEEMASAFADAASRQLKSLLEAIGEGESVPATVQSTANMINDLMVYARSRLGLGESEEESIALPPRRLLSIAPAGISAERPATGMESPWLFTAGKGTPSLLEELRREIASSDHIDILVSFIKVQGIRKIMDLLERMTAQGAQSTVESGRRPLIRVLTTTYTGATDAEALDRLGRLPGVSVKVSLDGRRNRLHAKAWIFHRNSGFGCAYVGSANLSGAALLGGLEWTVKFTEHGQADLYYRAKAHFETLWNDPEFQVYDPSVEGHQQTLREALARERGSLANPDSQDLYFNYFELASKTYQASMLEDLANERSRGRMRNLVVAATGTGKTMVAAFDYRRTCQEIGGYPRLLFVAHRREIILQAQRTFREVLHDHSFGQVLTQGYTPTHHDHLFATIQSLDSNELIRSRGPDFWHTVIIDECHRLAANLFDTFATWIKPHILLGLTATPERSDGQPIDRYFDNKPDGSPAVELRLWTALDMQLLAPFEYFGCDDDTDFSEVPWDRAGERDALDKILSANDERAGLVIDQWKRLSGNPGTTRTLAFCVSVAHAEFMAKAFNRAGYPSICLSGSTGPDIRRIAPKKLESGEICAIVTCDLFNEGIDLPSVDTILLLRPTQSPVLFQQQLGRGLRLHPGKESCLVLDFVGRFRTDFRVDQLFRVITGLTRNELEEALEKGFDRLPLGCHIHLDPQPRQRILQNLRAITWQTWRRLQTEVQAWVALKGRAQLSLARFLYDQHLELEDIYRGSVKSGWTSLLRDAGIDRSPEREEDAYFSKRFSDLLHIDDSRRTDALCKLAREGSGFQADSSSESLLLQMLAYQVDGERTRIGSWQEFLARFAKSPELKSELGELGELLAEKANIQPLKVPGIEDTPLVLHASYFSREILTAVGWLTAERRTPFQAGVLALPGRKCELLFVTLDKREGFRADIAYRDYAISPTIFHWQSQNTAGPETRSGKRYLESTGNDWTFQLFVRENRSRPYKACGPVKLTSWEGSHPISIVWNLETPLSPSLFSSFSVLRDA